MRFGFIVPHNYGLKRPEDVTRVAVRAEELGFDSVWVNHHVLHAGFILDRLGDKPYYDSLTVLTYASALTSRVRLGTSVLVLPYLNPIVLAKTLATLDVLSGGRVIAGVGVGGLRQESDALGKDFERRGAYTNESIAIMKELWTASDPAFDGEFFRFSGVKFSPKPAQKPHPPVWVGGQSNAALRRVARRGDGWHPTAITPEQLGDRLDYLRARLQESGRTVAELTVSVRAELDVLGAGSEPQGLVQGAPDHLLSSVESYAAVGVDEMIFAMSTDDTSRIDRVMEAFATQVMPKARG